MTKRNKIILILTVAIALIGIIALILSKTTGTFSRELKDFAIDDTASVTKIFMADKNNNQVLLKKDPNGIWILNDKYIANQNNVNLLLYTMQYISVWSPVQKSAHNNIIKRMSVVSTKVEIYQNTYLIDFWGIKLFKGERLTKTYYVGEPTMTNEGNFMLMEGSSTAFIVNLPGFRGYVSPRYSPYEVDWRDHTVFQTRLPQIKEIISENIEIPNESFIVKKIGSRTFQLESMMDKQIIPDYDTVKVVDFVSAFRKINYEAVAKDLTKTYLDTIIRFNHFYTLTLTDINGKKTIAKMYRLPELLITDYQTKDEKVESAYNLDRFYLKLNDDKEMYVAQYFVFDRMLQPLSYYLKTKFKK